MSRKKAVFDYESKQEASKKIEEIRANYVEQFWLEEKIIVHKIKPGYGTSNTGPMGDKFYEKAEITSKILNIDLEYFLFAQKG